MATKIHLVAPIGDIADRGITRADLLYGRWFLLGVTSGNYTPPRLSNLYAGICLCAITGRCHLIGIRGQRNGEGIFVPSGLSDEFITNHHIHAEGTHSDPTIRFIRYLNEDEFVAQSGRGS